MVEDEFMIENNKVCSIKLLDDPIYFLIKKEDFILDFIIERTTQKSEKKKTQKNQWRRVGHSKLNSLSILLNLNLVVDRGKLG